MRDAAWFVLVAGPNGSGKSTFVEGSSTVRDLCGGDPVVLDPDALARELTASEGLEGEVANARAVLLVEARVQACIAQRQSCIVETVLSTDKYQRHVEAAAKQGMRVLVVYVALSDPDLNVRRVGMRHIAGGHDVPAEKIRSRRTPSFDQLPWFVEHADRALIYCNDRPKGPPNLIAEKNEHGLCILDEEAIPELTSRLRRE